MVKKKILFISYGGGHIELIKTILDNCIDYNKFDVDLIALTVAYDAVQNPRINKYRVSDFDFLFKNHKDEIDYYGNKLLEDNFNPNSKIPLKEIVFYLGISYFDLVNELGLKLAFENYKIKKRQAFNPKNSLKKIIKHISPNYVFTTNSPRMESASIYAAKELNIKSIQILDLFGDDFPIPSADNIIVMNEFVKNKLLQSGSIRNVFSLGQPIFDRTIEEVEKVNKEKILTKLGYSINDRIILFCPSPYYIWNNDLSVKEIRDESIINIPIFSILSNLTRIFKVKIILRPHPVSDSIENYRKYIEKDKMIQYYSDLDLNLFESLAISEMVLTYNSTVGVQAAICNKVVSTFNYDENQNYLWDSYMKAPFIFSQNLQDLNTKLHKYFSSDPEKNYNQKFYEVGANKRIYNYINHVLWNS